MGAAKSYIVSGALVVLPTPGGSERYVYRGATVSADGFTEAGIAHALEVGLIQEAPEGAVSDDDQQPASSDAPSKSWNHAQLDAWAAKQSPPFTFDESKAEEGKPLTKDQKLEQIAALAE
jgi:hypothetical protein